MLIQHVFDHSLPLQSGYVYRSLGILGAQRAMGWQTAHLTTPRYNAGEPFPPVDSVPSGPGPAGVERIRNGVTVARRRSMH